MKKNNLKIVMAVVILLTVQYAFCGHHHRHDDGRGVRLATDIVNLVHKSSCLLKAFVQKCCCLLKMSVFWFEKSIKTTCLKK